jgi:hypothetical protein
MAYTYLFFQPTKLPLTPEELDGDTVQPLADADAVRRALSGLYPELVWESPEAGRLTLDGRWLEFSLVPEVGTLSLRCSLRADYRDVVQRLCDELGWLAFDEMPLCYQPGRSPMDA